ncbi:MAG TPA: hypothetical protein QKA08_02500 [Candidatus Megaira endosymbiont of Nemacystus decipiens]|nr:hypothetical protein [Candidatus Megaera endosymbiont of Nemacystus decipiens]
MPQFDTTFFSSQLFWLLCFFGLLYFAVSRYIAPTIEYIINKRSGAIEKNISDAQEYNDKIKSIEAYKDELMLGINSQISDMQVTAKKIFDEQQDKKRSILLKEIKEKEEIANKDIEKYINIFKRQQPQYLLKLSSYIITKITNKDVDTNILEQIHEKNT